MVGEVFDPAGDEVVGGEADEDDGAGCCAGGESHVDKGASAVDVLRNAGLKVLRRGESGWRTVGITATVNPELSIVLRVVL